ncbi:MAG: hypothetical protein LUF92_14790 [Clostridiales bacterium]|nr:hypothetical protein [Clostridiales bacterium]
MRKRKRLTILIIVIIAAVVVLGVSLATGIGGSTDKGSASEETTDDISGIVSDDNGTSLDGSDASGSSGSGSNASENSGSESSGSGSSGTESSGGSNTEKGQFITGDSITTMGFPYTDESEGITIETLYSYSGYYLEDGSEDEISEVAMLEVTNTSENVIEYGTIRLTADGEALQFHVSLIPAGATVLVMEADKKSCSESADCSYNGSEIAYITAFDMCEDLVRVENDGSGAITVTNISGAEIPVLRLFYKNQMETGEYVGGITYNVKLEDLAAGESQTVYPSHFDPEYGVVLMVRTYDAE